MIPPDIIWIIVIIIVTVASIIVASIGFTVVILALTGLISVPFLKLFLRQRSVSKKLAASGVVAPATLVNAQLGGAKVTYNGVDARWRANLTVQVQPADGPAFLAQVSHFIPVLEIPRYQPGATLVVLYDPADRSQVAVLRNLGVLTEVVQAMGMEPQAAYKLVLDSELLEADLERKGAVVAPAQVVTADKVGVQMYNGAAEMLQLTLDVQPPQGVPFRAQTTAAVVVASLAKYQPGAAVTVRYDPQDPQRVVVESAG